MRLLLGLGLVCALSGLPRAQEADPPEGLSELAGIVPEEELPPASPAPAALTPAPAPVEKPLASPAEPGAAKPTAPPAAAPLVVKPAAPPLVRPQPATRPNAPGDHSKLDARAPDKLPRLAKVKECCGYPIGLKEDFRLSFYWLAYESDYASLRYDTDIYTKQGFFIGRFPSAFVFELKLEGSGVLNDGRILNYDGECNYGMGTCFKTLALDEHPLGAGVQGRRLVPFRSIAVDPRYIPIGSPVYIPELVGILLPDGTRHDGCLRADDMGGAIKQHKIDFFVESYDNFKFIADNLWWHLKATPIVEEPRCEYLRLHDPRERTNEHTDWAQLHLRQLQARLAANARAAVSRMKRNRAAAQAWVKRHYGGKTQKPGTRLAQKTRRK